MLQLFLFINDTQNYAILDGVNLYTHSIWINSRIQNMLEILVKSRIS